MVSHKSKGWVGSVSNNLKNTMTMTMTMTMTVTMTMMVIVSYHVVVIQNTIVIR